MKIDYAKIIESANLRKERLQAFEATLAPAEEMLNKLEEALNWLNSVKQARNQIDTEGVKLVPSNLWGSLAALESHVLCYYTAMVVGVNGDTPDLLDLRRALGIGEEPSE